MEYIIITLALSLILGMQWTHSKVTDVRRRLIDVEVDTSVLMERPHQGDKPNISSTPRLTQSCELRVANGTPILVMPNGEILPNQTDLIIDSPFNGQEKKLIRATVTLLINAEDSLWLGAVTAEGMYQRIKNVATA